MNLRSLRVFVNVIEEGTLARASAKMNLSQPAASRLIQILEEEFATTLFFRDKKRLTPTPEGEIFYPEALRILGSIDDIPGLFDQIKTSAIVPLRIICHPRLVNGLVVPAMVKLYERDPKIRMKLEVHPRRSLGSRIMHDMYDVGVSALPLPVENPKPEIFAQSEVMVVLSKSHQLAEKPFLTRQDLTDKPYIALDETTLLRQIVDKAQAETDHPMWINHEVSTSDAAFRLAKAGLGFAFTDRITLDPDMIKNLAVVAWKPETVIKYGYFVSRTTRSHPAQSAFVECLKEVCDEKV